MLRLETAHWELLRWVSPEVGAATLDAAVLPSGATRATDAKEQPVILFPSEWKLKYFQKEHPGVMLGDVPFAK